MTIVDSVEERLGLAHARGQGEGHHVLDGVVARDSGGVNVGILALGRE